MDGKQATMSPRFFALPRELRDMIYTSLITSSLALPDPESTHDRHVWQLNKEAWFSRALPPRTSCANMLAANRQVYEEMTYAIERARQAGLLVARLDCIVKDRYEGGPWFTWLSIPIVRRDEEQEIRELEEKTRLVVNLKSWGSNVPIVGRLFPSLPLGKATQMAVQESPKVSIERLQIDIRMVENRASPSQRDWGPWIQWAICSALKRICQHKHEVGSIQGWPEALTVDTLILSCQYQRTLPTRRQNRRRTMPKLSPATSSMYGVRSGQTPIARAGVIPFCLSASSASEFVWMKHWLGRGN
jgi:hypothetical protein